MKNANCLFLLIFSTYFLNNFSEVTSEVSYKKYLLEDPHVCSPNVKRKLKLGKDSKSAILVTQSTLSYHAVDWDKNANCKFEVQVDNKLGLYAVIQQLNLRRNSSTGECMDYIQFRSKERRMSRKYCGIINAVTTMDELIDDNDAENTGNSFIDPLGEIDVFIFISKEPLSYIERTEIIIVFTAYSKCNRDTSDYIKCGIDQGCIYKDFFGDGYFNCPFYGCPDEDGCSIKTNYNVDVKKESIGNKVLIGSVTSLILMFTIFICCIYVCKKYGAFCWAESFAQVNAQSNPTQSTSNDEPIRIDNLREPNVPTAPTADDKDLPPSYESLFPSR